MYLIYLDEVKYDPPKQLRQWLCGLAIDDSVIQEVDIQLSNLAKSYFGCPLLGDETEFHAQDIVHGKGSFKNHKIDKRLELYKALLKIIDRPEDIKKIEISVIPERIQHEMDFADTAFMFFVERADGLMQRFDSIGLLIADDDPEKKSSNVGSLSFYKEYRTNWAYGKVIKKLIDTIHHTRSHHSRLLQIADIYVYSCALVEGEQNKYFQKTIKEYVLRETEINSPTTYKHWPTSQSVYLKT